MERRKNTRVTFQTTADLSFNHRNYRQCETQNLSLKGMSVRGITGHTCGEICDISLALSGSSSRLVLNMRGEIVRVDEDGIGLHFIDIDLDSFYHLKNILYYNADDPDKVAGEVA
ncbi:MAG: PilZ domain-containing protein [Deltaproteobacteria bacterium]|nr:PilZ domain-containing protein [Deltaproteobacteria bacterium]